MKDIQYVILKKEYFGDFISRLSRLKKLAAPVGKGYDNYSFEPVTSSDKVALHYKPTILPPKKYFLPRQETVIEYSLNKDLRAEAVVQYERMVLFGVHTCDLAGIQCLNMVFSQRPKDYNYLIRKNKIDIIGLECNEYCDEYASCNLVNASMPSGGYDLFFTDMGDYFVIHINTQVGDEILDATKFVEPAAKSHLRELVRLREKKRDIFRNELDIEARNIPALFDRLFESNVWKDLGERCLACGNCTNVCPTCYCFDIVDDVNLELRGGRRY
ncbi:MAG TPA: 4Fe-4S dicluster domain-containing protein, partial [Thermodesulfovibrionales bacterium]|nr:4Fe-4S dicluster domain-containing protein [Thermodesulfovibrionales bacterium]